MAKGTVSINLLRDNKSLLDKFVDWALSAGRTIVILTEVIALSAFLYRFSLDRQIIDLRDEIKQKQLYVTQLEPAEEQYRNLQTRLGTAKKLKDQSIKTTKILDDIITLSNGRLRLNSVRVGNDGIQIEANTTAVGHLNYFVNKLKQHPEITRVSLDNLDNKTSLATIEVTITAHTKDTKSIDTQSAEPLPEEEVADESGESGGL